MSSLNPRTPLERKVRNDVRALREREERSALAGIRDGYKYAEDATLGRMDGWKDRTIREASRLAEKHGAKDFRRELIDMLSNLREEERRHVKRDMDAGNREDYRRAKEGMEENQVKDEKQIVQLTRRILENRDKSWFREAMYPHEAGSLTKAEDDALRRAKAKPEPHPSIRIEFTTNNDAMKEYVERAENDLRNNDVIKLLLNPKDDMHDPMGDDKIKHTASVASIAGRLALLHPSFGLDPNDAWLAGALHDRFDRSRLREKGTDESRKSNPDWFWITGHDHHGPLSAAKLQHEGILDDGWHDAIRHHSTGNHGMHPRMKIILLADSIGPDRGKSKELHILRREAFSRPDYAIGMLLNALMNAVTRGHGHNRLQDGVDYNPFHANNNLLRLYRFFGDDGGPTSRHPLEMTHLVGMRDNITGPLFDEGITPHLDFQNKNVRRILGSAFSQIDEADDKPEAMATWLTARNRRGAMFRMILPAIWPLVFARYGKYIKQANKESDGKSETTLSDIAAISKLINADSLKNKTHVSRFLNNDWLAGKPKSQLFIIRQHMNFHPVHMHPREMHKSFMNIEALLPKPLQRPVFYSWHMADRTW